MRYKATATQKYYVFVEADNADEIIANENIEDLDGIPNPERLRIHL